MEANLTEFMVRTKPYRRRMPTRLGRRIRKMVRVPISRYDVYDVMTVSAREIGHMANSKALTLKISQRIYVERDDRSRIFAIFDGLGVTRADRYIQQNDEGCIWVQCSLTSDPDFRFCVDMYHLFDEADELISSSPDEH